jgi:uncharacterized membrane protein
MEDLRVSGHNRRQLSAAETAAMEEKIRKIEIAISLVLRIGVTLSILVVAAGLAIMFFHHSAYVSFSGDFSYKALTSKHSQFPHSFGSVARSIARGDGEGIVVGGVMLLILTPVLRVAVGVLSFMYEKDVPMTIVTLYVLAVLIGSFFLAGA